MTAHTQVAPSAHASAPLWDSITKLAQDVQSQCGLIESLGEAIDDAVDLLTCESPAESRATTRIIQFANLIREISRKAADQAEQVERCAAQARHSEREGC